MEVKRKDLLQYENKRFFSKKLWVCIIIFFVINSIFLGYRYKETKDDIIYKEIVNEYKGESTTEKNQQIIDNAIYYNNIIESYLEVTDEYARGKINDDVFEKYISDYNYAKHHINALERLSDHAKTFLKSDSKTFYFYDVAWDKLLDKHIDWSFLFMTIILFVPYFYIDYDTKIFAINNSYYKYKKILHFRLKYAICVIILLQVVWFAMELGIVNIFSSLPDAFSSACSLQGFTSVHSIISLLSLFVIKMIIFIIADILAIVVLYFISAKLRNKILATILMIFYLPLSWYVCMELLTKL